MTVEVAEEEVEEAIVEVVVVDILGMVVDGEMEEVLEMVEETEVGAEEMEAAVTDRDTKLVGTGTIASEDSQLQVISSAGRAQ